MPGQRFSSDPLGSYGAELWFLSRICNVIQPNGVSWRRIPPGAEAQNAYLERIDKLLARDDLHAREAVEKVHLGPDLSRVALDLDAPVARSAPTAEREHRDPLALDVLRRDGGQ